MNFRTEKLNNLNHNHKCERRVLVYWIDHKGVQVGPDLIANSPFDLRAYTGKIRRRIESFTRSPFNQLCFPLLLLFVLFCLIWTWDLTCDQAFFFFRGKERKNTWYIYFTSDLSSLGQSFVTGILLQCCAFLWAKPDTGKSVSSRNATGSKFESHTVKSH